MNCQTIHGSFFILSYYFDIRNNWNHQNNAYKLCTIAELASQLALPERGVAIAVNNKMIPRTEWNERILQPNDNLVVIKAACGG